jgi:hypothetical protein
MQKVLCEKCEAEVTLICNGHFAVCFDDDFIYNIRDQSGEMVLKNGVLVDDFIESDQSKLFTKGLKDQAA